MINAVGIALFGADIAPGAVIGGGLRIAHSVGIVIGYDVVLGSNVQIFQNVTIGSGNAERDGRVMPTIGDNVRIFAGSVTIGPIIIGKNSTIGANAVVTKDFPSDVVIAGIPGRIVGRIDRALEDASQRP
jgi:serine O-acetyltransferase